MNLSESSLGLLETRGLTGALVAADAMLKAANVEIFKHHMPGGGRVTVMCMGELSACAAAISAGAAAAAQVGELLAQSVIARPEGGAVGICGALGGSAAEPEQQKPPVEKSPAGQRARGKLR